MGIDRHFADVPADEFLPLLWHVTDHVVQHADGSLGTTFRLPGRPLGLTDLDGRYAARRQRHAAYRALFDTNVTIYEHHVCHDVVLPFAPGATRSAYARELLEHFASRLGRLAPYTGAEVGMAGSYSRDLRSRAAISAKPR